MPEAKDWLILTLCLLLIGCIIWAALCTAKKGVFACQCDESSCPVCPDPSQQLPGMALTETFVRKPIGQELLPGEATPNSCMDVSGGHDAIGTSVNLAACNGQDNQKFTFHAGELLSAIAASKCISADSNGVVTLQQCSDSGAKWKVSKWGNGTGSILQNPDGTTCLGTVGVGGPLVATACANVAAQKWVFGGPLTGG